MRGKDLSAKMRVRDRWAGVRRSWFRGSPLSSPPRSRSGASLGREERVANPVTYAIVKIEGGLNLRAPVSRWASTGLHDRRRRRSLHSLPERDFRDADRAQPECDEPVLLRRWAVVGFHSRRSTDESRGDGQRPRRFDAAPRIGLGASWSDAGEIFLRTELDGNLASLIE